MSSEERSAAVSRWMRGGPLIAVGLVALASAIHNGLGWLYGLTVAVLVIPLFASPWIALLLRKRRGNVDGYRFTGSRKGPIRRQFLSCEIRSDHLEWTWDPKERTPEEGSPTTLVADAGQIRSLELSNALRILLISHVKVTLASGEVDEFNLNAPIAEVRQALVTSGFAVSAPTP